MNAGRAEHPEYDWVIVEPLKWWKERHGYVNGLVYTKEDLKRAMRTDGIVKIAYRTAYCVSKPLDFVV